MESQPQNAEFRNNSENFYPSGHGSRKQWKRHQNWGAVAQW